MLLRQWLAQCFGTSGLRFGAEVLRHSLGRSYVTHGLCCWSHCWCVPHYMCRCSPRHLTSHFSHTYISTHSLHSHWVHFFLCDSRSVQATSLGFWRQRESHLCRYTSRIRTETSHFCKIRAYLFVSYFLVCSIVTSLLYLVSTKVVRNQSG